MFEKLFYHPLFSPYFIVKNFWNIKDFILWRIFIVFYDIIFILAIIIIFVREFNLISSISDLVEHLWIFLLFYIWVRFILSYFIYIIIIGFDYIKKGKN